MRNMKQRDVQQKQISNALEELQWMREHLASAKFQGELEDNINVRDVDAFVLRLRDMLNS